MTIREIEQNTDSLADDIARLETETSALEKAIDSMFEAVNALDSMWTGTAHDSFRAQFQSDYETCKSMHKTLSAFIEKLNRAREEYDRCEAAVGDLVRSINI